VLAADVGDDEVVAFKAKLVDRFLGRDHVVEDDALFVSCHIFRH
jgi:hypothetical protein